MGTMATRSDRISVRLEADELVMLQQLAAKQGVSTSEALRGMIRDAFKRKKLTLKSAARATKKAPAKPAAKRSLAKKATKKAGRR